MNTVTFDNKLISDNSVSLTPSFTVINQPDASLYCVVVSTNVAPGNHAGVSYGGQAMSRIQQGNSNGNTQMDVFELIHPPTGANTLTVSPAGGNTGTWFAVYSYYHTTAATDGSAIVVTNPTATGIQNSLATVAANCIMLGVGFGNNASVTPTGMTNNSGSDVHTNTILAGDSGVQASGGTAVNQQVNGASGVYQLAQISIAPNNSTTAPLTLSIMSGASRAVTMAKTLANTRTASITMLRAAGLAMTVVRDWPRSVSLTMMNAASRFITLFSKGGIWTDAVKHASTFINQTKD